MLWIHLGADNFFDQINLGLVGFGLVFYFFMKSRVRIFEWI